MSEKIRKTTKAPNITGHTLRIILGVAILGLLLASSAEAQVIIPYLDSGYKYKVVVFDEIPGFEQPAFDDSGFSIGDAGFGQQSGYCSLNNPTYVKTIWPTNTDILLRKELNLPSGTTNVKIGVAVDNDVQVFINGYDISGGLIRHDGCPSRDSFVFSAPDSTIKTGSNLIAVRVRDRGEYNYADIQVTADIIETPTPTPTSTPVPEPLIVDIISPTNNFYSEESVDFKGTASGGVPPYTYTWTSNRVAEVLGDTAEFSTKLAFNKETQEMNKHTITLTVMDNVGTVAIKTAELNIVVQKVKVLVVPVVVTGNAISPEDWNRMVSLSVGATDYYLKSSYGAVYLDFIAGPTISSDVLLPIIGDTENPGRLQGRILDDVQTKLKSDLYKLPPYSIDLFQYDTVIIADTEDIYPEETWADQDSGKIPDSEIPIKTAIIVNIGKNARYGGWNHEIGHALGNRLRSSELNNEYKTTTKLPLQRLLWGGVADDCADLYNCGNVGGWDLMAKGNGVYGSETYMFLPVESLVNNQPTDMSVVSKIKLGWLNKNTVLGTNAINGLIGEYSVTSTENMHYGDDVIVYKSSSSSNKEFYIEARELKQPSNYIDFWVHSELFGDLNGWYTLNNGVVIYEVDRGSGMHVNTLNSNSEYAPTFLASKGTEAWPIINVPEDVMFSIIESNPTRPYNVKIKIGTCDSACQNIKGMMMISEFKSGKKPSPSFNSGSNNTVPDLDLHAVTPSGLHIGMNYTNGSYEMQIPGGVTSGDLIGGEEWTFVPTGTAVRYYVDSHDVQQYLDENSDVDPANVTINYTTTLMEYGENPQRVELPDGNWTVINRTVSVSKESTIEPGTISEVLVYSFSGFLSPINEDEIKVSKIGSTIPVKFQLTNASGSYVANAEVKFSATKISDSLEGTDLGTVPINSATTGNLFRYDPENNQYIYNWGTKGLSEGTWKIILELDDGTTRSVNIGLRK